MREKHTKSIDGHEWEVTEFPATVGLKLMTRLIKLMGGPIGKAFAGVEGGAGIMETKIDFGAIGEGVKELAERLDEDEVVELVRRLLRDTKCDGRDTVKIFDDVFACRYMTLLKVVMFVVEVNYKIPLSGLPDFQGLLRTAPETEGKDQTPA